MKTLLILAAFVFCIPAFGDAPPPVCANHRGIANLNPLGARALTWIRSCVELYCASQTVMEGSRDNLKVIDEALASFTKYGSEAEEYFRLCARYVAAPCQSCPAKTAVENALLKVGNAGHDAYPRALAISSRAGPDGTPAPISNAGNYAEFANAIASTEKKPACAQEIHQKVPQLFNKFSSYMQRVNSANCGR